MQPQPQDPLTTVAGRRIANYRNSAGREVKLPVELNRKPIPDITPLDWLLTSIIPLCPEVIGYLRGMAKDTCPLGTSNIESVPRIAPLLSRILRDRLAGLESDWLANASPLTYPTLSYGATKVTEVDVVKGEVPSELAAESRYLKRANPPIVAAGCASSSAQPTTVLAD